MRAWLLIMFLLLGYGLGCAPPEEEVVGETASAEGPVYASPAAQDIIERMVAAHGGLSRWQATPTVQFEALQEFVHAGGGMGMVFREQVTVEQGPRRAYVLFPSADSATGYVAYDGETAWKGGTLEGLAAFAPARFLAWKDYYLYTLPWMTQDTGVRLGVPSTGSLPGDSTVYHTVPMTFAPGVGDTPKDRYLLYISPQTYRLRAVEVVMTYASLLPPDVEASPPSLLVYEAFETVEGLVVPVRYAAYWKDTQELVMLGRVTGWSFEASFEEARMMKPPDAVVDTSQPVRSAMQE